MVDRRVGFVAASISPAIGLCAQSLAKIDFKIDDRMI
jgi:hypothetical protein